MANLFIGLSTGSNIWDADAEELAADVALIADTGVTDVRIDLKWDIVETSDDSYTWTVPDAIFDGFGGAGIRVLWAVRNTPAWARTGGDVNTLPDDPADFAAFCAVAVARYKDRGVRARFWQVWNEPNSDSHITNPNDVAGYYALLVAGHNAIKGADPTARVVLGGLLRGGDYDVGQPTLLDTFFLRRLYDLGGAAYFDVLDFHTYSYPDDPADVTPTGEAIESEKVGNAGFDANIDGWTGESNGTASWDETAGIGGGGALKMICDGVGVSVNNPGGFPVDSGSIYVVRGWIYSADHLAYTIQFDYFDSGWSYQSSYVGATTTIPASTWTEIGFYATVPEVNCSLVLKSIGTPSNLDEYFLDDFTVFKASAPDHGWNRLTPIRTLMAANGDSTKPIWIGEYGQHTGTHVDAVSEADQATFVTAAHTRALTESQVSALFYFSHKDLGSDLAIKNDNYGLVEDDYVEKTAYGTFSALVQAANDAEYLTLGVN